MNAGAGGLVLLACGNFDDGCGGTLVCICAGRRTCQNHICVKPD